MGYNIFGMNFVSQVDVARYINKANPDIPIKTAQTWFWHNRNNSHGVPVEDFIMKKVEQAGKYGKMKDGRNNSSGNRSLKEYGNFKFPITLFGEDY